MKALEPADFLEQILAEMRDTPRLWTSLEL